MADSAEGKNATAGDVVQDVSGVKEADDRRKVDPGECQSGDVKADDEVQDVEDDQTEADKTDLGNVEVKNEGSKDEKDGFEVSHPETASRSPDDTVASEVTVPSAVDAETKNIEAKLQKESVEGETAEKDLSLEETKAETEQVKLDVSNVNVSDVKASDTKVSDAKGSDVKVSDVKVSDAEASDAKVSDAKGSDVKVSEVKVSDAEASDAKVSDAKGSDVKVSDANVSDAETSDAKASDAAANNFSKESSDISETQTNESESDGPVDGGSVHDNKLEKSVDSSINNSEDNKEDLDQEIPTAAGTLEHTNAVDGTHESDKKPLSILNMPGPDEAKFEKLRELLQMNEISSKDFVNTVFGLIAGKLFDLDSNFIITKGSNVLHMVDLMDDCPPKLQAELWSLFSAGVRRNTVNLQICVSIGLAEKIVAKIENYDDMLAEILVDLLGVLGSFSISVKELQMVFSHLQTRNGKWPRHSMKLLKVLHQMPLQSGPSEFFSFPGLKGSVIALPPLSKWPIQTGWTFHCWFRLDPVMGTISNREKPYIFCFRTGKGVGYSGHFFGNAFVITSIKTKGKGFQHCVRYDFQPREWNMVTIAFVYNRWTTSELNCFVNGKLVSHAEISWPVSTNDVFDKCYLGSSAEMEEDSMFCGQMSSVYLFGEALQEHQAEALYMLGPSHSSQLKFEGDVALTDDMRRVLYDGKLSSSIVFLYTPVTCDGQLCLDSSPKGNPSYFMHSPHALILGETRPCITHSVYSSLHSIGGIQVFFPLFEQLDLVEDTDPGVPEKVNYTICTSLMRLLCKLLYGSSFIQQQLLQCRAFLVLGYVLEKSSKQHLTTEVLDSFASMATFLLANPTGGLTLLKQLFDSILLNPNLWISASVEVQRNLYSILLNFVNGPDNPVIAYRVSYIVHTMHKLMYYYWVVKPSGDGKVIPNEIAGPRPSPNEILELRDLMLKSIMHLVKVDSKIEDEELQSIISYLISVQEDENLLDVLELLVQLMAEVPASLVPAFDRTGGIKVVFKLLGSSNEKIQVQSLKLLGFFLARSMTKRKLDSMGPFNLYTLITEKLMLHSTHINMEIYNVLFEILTERMTFGTATTEHPSPDVSYKIENPLMLKVIAQLIHPSKQRQPIMEIKDLFLSDLHTLLLNSRENRRTILQMSVWQEWLFSLAYINPRNEFEQKVTDMVLKIFGLLLFHAVKLEVGGWRVWIDTQAILHSKVSFEEFRIKASQYYRQLGKNQEQGLQQGNLDVKKHQAKEIDGEVSGKTEQKLVDGKPANEIGENAAQFVNKVVDHAVSVVTSPENHAEAVDQKFNEEAAAKQPAEASLSKRNSDLAHERLGESSPAESKHGRKPMNSVSERHVFSPGPRSPAFTIPEFRWTSLHVKLLGDLLALFEKEMDVWKSHTTKSVIEFVNASENQVFVINLTQIVSQLSDGLVSSCGGLLPLLASATSNMNEVEGSEPGHGLSVVQASSFLQRIVCIVDILIFASNLNLGSLEQDKMMNTGGILRQSLRLVCTGVVRSCLECRLRHQIQNGSAAAVDKTDRKILEFILGPHSTVASFDPETVLNLLSSDTGPVRDIEKLIQDLDINRLRAVVYRNIDETKQSEFLALAIVYFICVLMVSKYRDILEPVPSGARRLSSTSTRGDEDSKKAASSASAKPANAEENLPAKEESIGKAKQPEAVGSDSGENRTPDDEKDVAGKQTDEDQKAAAGSEAEATQAPNVENQLPSDVSADVKEEQISSISASGHSDSAPQAGETRNQPLTQQNLPKSMEIKATAQEDSGRLTEKLQRVLGSLAPLVREIFVDFAVYLSRTLLGSHGQALVPGGMTTLKQSTSVVELVMLLCSQEWQNSLQKFAGLAFVELVNEGRLSSVATNDHIVRVANEAEFILKRLRADDIQKHSDFQNVCKKSFYERSEEMKLCDHLITSSHIRDQIIASQQCDKVRDIVAVGRVARLEDEKGSKVEFWKLDKWEDDSRRRRRLIRNPVGNSHVNAVFSPSGTEAVAKDGSDSGDPPSVKYELNYNQQHKLPSPDSVKDDELLQGDDRDMEDLAGMVAMSTPCRMISPGAVICGTLSITKAELYFEISRDDPRNKQINPQVLQYVEYQHSKWHFRDIRAIFSRRYRLQNTAIEIFISSRTAIMFAFEDFAVVKRVVGALPRVGIGVKYGLPQTRRVSLASPRQIFKMSNMTRRWQQNEVSNFDYLMFINTVAGRTYCDLSQYLVYPWVIANYDTPDLDLSNVANYRDFSKPVGALNPTRRDYFEERYNSFAKADTPPRHYDTHYSVAASTLDWLVRLEPFTTFYLSQHNGKFGHPGKLFHSVVQSWKNCFLDATNELIPEFFYLPEMFVNINGLDLGANADGEDVGHVELPPWAKTPEDFVRIMRMALESEIVSAQLNQWIDLVFGYRQRGPEAVRAQNVFHHLTYEGGINWDAIADPAVKQALEDQIFSLGQTPSQLLTEPHPPRSTGISSLTPLIPTLKREDVCMIMKFLSNSPVVHVSANTHPSVPVPAVITITANYSFAVNKWDHIGAGVQGPLPSFTEGAPQPLHLPLAMDPLLGLNRRSLGDENFDQRIMAKQATFVTTADNHFVLAGGFIDRSFRVFSTDSGKLCQIIYGHYDLVTCIARSECSINQDCYIVTGSRDCTVMVWHWTAKQQIISGDGTNPAQAASKATLVGHQSEVTCVVVSSELGVILSGSKDGPVLMHCISGELVRSFCPSVNCASPKLISLSREGYLFVCYEKGGVCSFGINGKALGHLALDDNIQAMILSRDGQFVILGGHSGAVKVWRSHDLKALYTYPTCDSPIQSLVLSHDHRFLMAGLATGCLVVFNIDFSKWLQDLQKLNQP